MRVRFTDFTSMNINGSKANIIATWLIKIQNLLRPKRLRVKESMIGPIKTFKVQGIMVIDNNKEISETEAPIETR
jgi:hypothetical protein